MFVASMHSFGIVVGGKWMYPTDDDGVTATASATATRRTRWRALMGNSFCSGSVELNDLNEQTGAGQHSEPRRYGPGIRLLVARTLQRAARRAAAVRGRGRSRSILRR